MRGSVESIVDGVGGAAQLVDGGNGAVLDIIDGFHGGAVGKVGADLIPFLIVIVGGDAPELVGGGALLAEVVVGGFGGGAIRKGGLNEAVFAVVFESSEKNFGRAIDEGAGNGGEKLGEMGSEFFRVQRIESFSSYKVSVPIQAPDPHMIDSARILKSERPSHEERIREREEVSREMLPCED